MGDIILNSDTSKYWEKRYRNKDTPWDLNEVHPALKELILPKIDRSDRILVPGAGFGHDAEWLWHEGFSNIYVCDWAPSALNQFKARLPQFPIEQLLLRDFFELNRAFDCIVEHTFFCALPPSRRQTYLETAGHLLERHCGRFLGILFGEELGRDNPPFGGREEEYEPLFQRQFNTVSLNEIDEQSSPRSVRELFIDARKC